MKDYEVTKIWATEIASLSQSIDDNIEYKRNRIKDMESEEHEKDSWYSQQIEELKEAIKTLEWALVQINSPFKIKK